MGGLRIFRYTDTDPCQSLPGPAFEEKLWEGLLYHQRRLGASYNRRANITHAVVSQVMPQENTIEQKIDRQNPWKTIFHYTHAGAHEMAKTGAAVKRLGICMRPPSTSRFPDLVHLA